MSSDPELSCLLALRLFRAPYLTANKQTSDVLLTKNLVAGKKLDMTHSQVYSVCHGLTAC